MRTVKIFFNSIRSLSFDKILKLAGFALSHPVFITLSIYATLHAFADAQKIYPDSASTNGRGNAFRHAYWCCLILMYCCKVSSSEKAMDFCKKMTDMHEELFPNEPLEKKMDLHNNKVGMDFFKSLLPGVHRQFFEKSFFVKELMRKTENAVLLEHLNQEAGNRLVYLNE